MGLDIFVFSEKSPRTNIAEFRKINFLVKFFNLENCKDYTTCEDELKDLVDRCREVLNKHDDSVSMKLLPTSEGFFFGDVRYNDSYYSNVELVMNTFNKVLDSFDFANDNIIIHAWW